MNILNVATILPAILGGLIIGSLIFNVFKLKFSEIYAMVITTLVFLFLMATTELTRTDGVTPGIEHWISVTVLYFLFIISAIVGQRFKRAALFLNLL